MNPWDRPCKTTSASAVAWDSDSGYRQLYYGICCISTSEGASYITTELALRWATQPAKVQPSSWAWRLSMVRRFAIWHSATEPRTRDSAQQVFSLIVIESTQASSQQVLKSGSPNNEWYLLGVTVD